MFKTKRSIGAHPQTDRLLHFHIIGKLNLKNNLKLERIPVKIDSPDGFDILMKNSTGFVGRNIK